MLLMHERRPGKICLALFFVLSAIIGIFRERSWPTMEFTSMLREFPPDHGCLLTYPAD